MLYVAFVNNYDAYCGWTTMMNSFVNYEAIFGDDDIKSLVFFSGPEYPEFGTEQEIDSAFEQITKLARKAVLERIKQ